MTISVSKALMIPVGLALVPALALAAPAHAVTPTCFGKPATIVGTDGDDQIAGTTRADVIVSLAGSDTIHGRGGNDRICSGDGDDTVYGDAGDDSINDGRGSLYQDVVFNDVVHPGPGFDRVVQVADLRAPWYDGPDTVSYADASSGRKVHLYRGQDSIVETLAGAPADTDTIEATTSIAVDGSPYVDGMVGSDGNDWLNGLGGADRIEGGAGEDRLSDDDPDATAPDADVLIGGPGDDVVLAGAGDDSLEGDAGADRLADEGTTSADVVDAGTGDDTVTDTVSTQRPETIAGGPGVDGITLYDEQSPQPLGVDLAAGTLTVETAGPTVDSALTGFEDAELYAAGRIDLSGTNGPNDLVTRSSLPTRIDGRGGNDLLVGGPADDSLEGGPGRDRALPDAGLDHCYSIERQRADDRCEVND